MNTYMSEGYRQTNKHRHAVVILLVTGDYSSPLIIRLSDGCTLCANSVQLPS